MKNPWSTDDQTNTGTTSEEPIGRGGVRGGLFVPERHELDTEGNAGFGDLDDGDAHDAKDDLHVERLEGLSNELGAVGWGSHCEEQEEDEGGREGGRKRGIEEVSVVVVIVIVIVVGGGGGGKTGR